MDRYFGEYIARARASPASELLALGRSRRRAARRLQHGRPRPPHLRLRQRREPAARRGLARSCFATVHARTCPSTRSRSATSPTASTPAPACRGRWPSSSTATSAPSGGAGRARPRPGRRVDAIPDEELWATHERRRERLVAFARRRLVRQLEQRGASARDIERARGRPRHPRPHDRLRPPLRDLQAGHPASCADPERLKRILLNAAAAGADHLRRQGPPQRQRGQGGAEGGRRASARREELRRHVVFLEDYDLVVARYLVQGVDVWLNTPAPRRWRRAARAGMKVLPNGGLNLSDPRRLVVRGLQARGRLGHRQGRGVRRTTPTRTQVESSALYELLENDIVPLFYGRGPRTACRAPGSPA